MTALDPATVRRLAKDRENGAILIFNRSCQHARTTGLLALPQQTGVPPQTPAVIPALIWQVSQTPQGSMEAQQVLPAPSKQAPAAARLRLRAESIWIAGGGFLIACLARRAAAAAPPRQSGMQRNSSEHCSHAKHKLSSGVQLPDWQNPHSNSVQVVFSFAGMQVLVAASQVTQSRVESGGDARLNRAAGTIETGAGTATLVRAAEGSTDTGVPVAGLALSADAATAPAIGHAAQKLLGTLLAHEAQTLIRRALTGLTDSALEFGAGGVLIRRFAGVGVDVADHAVAVGSCLPHSSVVQHWVVGSIQMKTGIPSIVRGQHSSDSAQQKKSPQH